MTGASSNPMRCVIIRYGEISLKGLNRRTFENALCRNIKAALGRARVPHGDIIRQFGRILIERCEDPAPLATVFGIVSYSSATRCEPTMDAIIRTALPFVSDLKAPRTFRVTAQRSQKTGPSSDDIARAVGQAIRDATGAPVKLRGFDVEIGIEMFLDSAFVFTQRIDGPGGLPAGTAGKILARVGDDRSVTAALTIARRGPEMVIIRGAELSDENARTIKAFGYELLEREPGDKDIPAVVVGQTLEEYSSVDERGRCVLRPLIAYTDRQIKEALHGFRAAARV